MFLLSLDEKFNIGSSDRLDEFWGYLKLFVKEKLLRSTVSNLYLQRGQLEWLSSHLSIQFMWNACLHPGDKRSTSMSSHFDKQTAHSRPSFEPLSDKKVKNGRESIILFCNPDTDRRTPSGSCSWSSGSLDRAEWHNLVYASNKKK